MDCLEGALCLLMAATTYVDCLEGALCLLMNIVSCFGLFVGASFLVVAAKAWVDYVRVVTACVYNVEVTTICVDFVGAATDYVKGFS